MLTENGKPVSVTSPADVTWSWDKRYLLMSIFRSDGEHLLKVSVADGTVKDLLGRPIPGAWTSFAFSPDGRFVAYTAYPDTGAVTSIIPSEGGASRTIAREARVLDWTHDGRFLMTLQSSLGTPRITAVPIQNGQAAGEPILLSRIPELSVGGAGRQEFLPHTTPGGAMVLMTGGNPSFEISLGTLDSVNRLSWKSLELVNVQTPSYPAWSADGRQIAYVARRNGQTQVRVRDVSTGQDREVYRTEEPLWICLWAHQHRTLYCEQTWTTKSDFVSVDIDSGRAEKIGTVDGLRILHVVSTDDRRLGGSRIDTLTGYQWDIETKQETSAGRMESADGRWRLQWGARDAENRRELRIRPASGTENEWKHLAYLRAPDVTGAVSPLALSFSPDGEWVFYYDKDLDGKDSLYRVRTSGGEPVRLGDFPTSDVASFLAVDPNGRQFIVELQKPAQQPEFWMFNNFIPKTSPAPKPASKAAAK